MFPTARVLTGTDRMLLHRTPASLPLIIRQTGLSGLRGIIRCAHDPYKGIIKQKSYPTGYFFPALPFESKLSTEVKTNLQGMAPDFQGDYSLRS